MVNRGSWIGIEISLLGGYFHNILVEHVLTFPPKVWSLLYNLDIIRVLCFFYQGSMGNSKKLGSKICLQMRIWSHHSGAPEKFQVVVVVC